MSHFTDSRAPAQSYQQQPPGSADYMSLFQGGASGKVEETFGLFESVLKKHYNEQAIGSFQFNQKLVPHDQALNLLENISGTFQFEKPKIDCYKRGPNFAKTSTQQKILYSSLQSPRKASAHH